MHTQIRMTFCRILNIIQLVLSSCRRIFLLGVFSTKKEAPVPASPPPSLTHLPRAAVGRGCCTGGGRPLQSHQGHGRVGCRRREGCAAVFVSLSPGRKRRVRLSSSSSTGGAPVRSGSASPLRSPESS